MSASWRTEAAQVVALWDDYDKGVLMTTAPALYWKIEYLRARLNRGD